MQNKQPPKMKKQYSSLKLYENLNKKLATIKMKTIKKMPINFANLFKQDDENANPTTFENGEIGFADLTEMNDITIESLLNNLKQRYQHDLIYVNFFFFFFFL